MRQFNPYHKWLGISPKHQPPDHYRLLGVDLHESDPDVIDAAAEQRMAFLHQYTTGEHLADAQRLLNELATARVCLLDPEKRRAYDKQLERAGKASHFDQRRPIQRHAFAWCAAICLILLVAGSALLFTRSEDPSNQDIAANQVRRIDAATAVDPATKVSRPERPAKPAVSGKSADVVSNVDPSADSDEVSNGSVSSNLAEVDDRRIIEYADSKIVESEQESTTPLQTTAANEPGPDSETETPASTPKLAPPDRNSQMIAKRQVRSIFESDFRQVKRREAKLNLAKKLLEHASEPEVESAQRYVCLTTALEFADKASAEELSDKALLELDRRFNVDIYALKHEALRRQFKSAQGPLSYDKLAVKSMQLVEDAIREKRYESAARIAKLSRAIAVKTRNPRLLVEAKISRDQSESLQKKSLKASNAKSIVTQQPDNGPANRNLGLFLCFVEGDWDRGLFHLARSNDRQTQLAAQLEQQGAAASLIGDAWWELAEGAEGDLQRDFQQRAQHWYEKAAKESASANGELAASRIRQAADNPKSYVKFYVTDLQEFDLILGPWGFAKGGRKGAYHADLIKVNGHHSKHGLGMHPPGGGYSRARYKLDGKFGTFLGGTVLASEPGSTAESQVTFIVLGDDRVLWKSKPEQRAQQVQDFAVDVRDVQVLELQTSCTGGQNNCHACWIDPYLIRAGGLAPR